MSERMSLTDEQKRRELESRYQFETTVKCAGYGYTEPLTYPTGEYRSQVWQMAWLAWQRGAEYGIAAERERAARVDSVHCTAHTLYERCGGATHSLCAAALTALAELVACKDMKDEIDAEHGKPVTHRIANLAADYECKKPWAWQAARKVLADAAAIRAGGEAS